MDRPTFIMFNGENTPGFKSNTTVLFKGESEIVKLPCCSLVQ